MTYLDAIVSITIPSILYWTVIKCFKMSYDYEREYQANIEKRIEDALEKTLKSKQP